MKKEKTMHEPIEEKKRIAEFINMCMDDNISFNEQEYPKIIEATGELLGNNELYQRGETPYNNDFGIELAIELIKTAMHNLYNTGKLAENRDIERLAKAIIDIEVAQFIKYIRLQIDAEEEDLYGLNQRLEELLEELKEEAKKNIEHTIQICLRLQQNSPQIYQDIHGDTIILLSKKLRIRNTEPIIANIIITKKGQIIIELNDGKYMLVQDIVSTAQLKELVEYMTDPLTEARKDINPYLFDEYAPLITDLIEKIRDYIEDPIKNGGNTEVITDDGFRIKISKEKDTDLIVIELCDYYDGTIALIKLKANKGNPQQPIYSVVYGNIVSPVAFFALMFLFEEKPTNSQRNQNDPTKINPKAEHDPYQEPKPNTSLKIKFDGKRAEILLQLLEKEGEGQDPLEKLIDKILKEEGYKRRDIFENLIKTVWPNLSIPEIAELYRLYLTRIQKTPPTNNNHYRYWILNFIYEQIVYKKEEIPDNMLPDLTKMLNALEKAINAVVFGSINYYIKYE